MRSNAMTGEGAAALNERAAGAALRHAGKRNGHEPCVLVVVADDAELSSRVRRALACSGAEVPVETVRGYLLALGRIGAVGAPRVLIGALCGAADELRASAASLRRLAGDDTRLWLLATADQAALGDDMVRAGFDRCLIDPIDDQALGRLLAQALNEAPLPGIKAPMSFDDHADEPAAPQAAAAPASAPEPAPAEEIAAELDESDDGLDEHLTRTLRFASSPGASAELAELGDLDLLDRMLAMRGGVRELAVTIIAAQSGVAGLEWSPGAGQAPADHAAVIVSYDNVTHGALHAPPPATSAQLEPWAAWLARWLALDRRTAELWEMALRDELTGAWNRRYFNRFLNMILQRAADERFRVTLLVFDIDNFKGYNDRYGHLAGDDILCEVSRLMRSLVRRQDVVARIGGDEFAVIFWDAESKRRPDSEHPANVQKIAQRFREAICRHRFPKLLHDAPGTLTVSGGLASFPWDGRTPEELFARADAMALQSKRQGKNVITLGPGATAAANRK